MLIAKWNIRRIQSIFIRVQKNIQIVVSNIRTY